MFKGRTGEPGPADIRERTMADQPDARALGAQVRALMRRAGQAALASSLARDGSARPYVSLVLATCDHDASPLLLISDLADHTRNLKADPRAALLFESVGGTGDPLARARASILGTVREVEDEDVRTRLQGRVTARHPSARTYAGFRDFHLYRMTIEGAHLVAGFGLVHWLEPDAVRFDTAGHGAMAEAEADIVAHMNQDHGDAVRLIATAMAGAETPKGATWTFAGIDPEGIDLRAGDRLARADFARPVGDPEGARAALVDLAREARRLADAKASSGK
jgi:putative heme iron utilization protein